KDALGKNRRHRGRGRRRRAERADRNRRKRKGHGARPGNAGRGGGRNRATGDLAAARRGDRGKRAPLRLPGCRWARPAPGNFVGSERGWRSGNRGGAETGRLGGHRSREFIKTRRSAACGKSASAEGDLEAEVNYLRRF